MSDNGDSKVQQLTLTRDRATGVVSLTTNVQMSIDEMLNVLLQAHRHLEVKFRIIMAIEAQQGIKQEQADREMAARIMGKH